MASPQSNGIFEEGSLPKKFKGIQRCTVLRFFHNNFILVANILALVNGSPVNGDRTSSGITYSEADSSNDVGSTIPSYGPDFDGDLVMPSPWANEAIPASPGHHSDPNEPSTSSGSRGEPLKEMLDCVEHQYVDEKTTKQLNDIENEV